MTGTGFDTNSQNNIVQLGGINCTCTATATQLTCAPGPNPFGDYHFSVNVLGKGLATLVDDPIVSFQLTATSIFPLSSGTGGLYHLKKYKIFRITILLFNFYSLIKEVLF